MNNKVGIFQSTKIINGFSACFRQWKASTTHCSYLHGYGIYFKITFEGELDYRNWVSDFGFLKRSRTTIPVVNKENYSKLSFTVSEWFNYMFDHTVVLAEDDPALDDFKKLYDAGIIQLRILPNVGCEMFAQLVYKTLNKFIKEETNYRVKIVQVECFEHEKNSAIYFESDLD